MRKTYRNLALNVNDQSCSTTCYPHVSANEGHWKWPFQSWGINRREDAAIKIDFGREVEIDRIILYTRADFPHDSWWEQATIRYSDGSAEKISMQKSISPMNL